MKERILAIFLLILAGLTIWAIAAELPEKEYAQTAASPAVANEVIRLHILADSDSDTDQQIKLALRDVLLPFLNTATLGAKTKEEALNQLTAQCAVLTEIANQTLEQWNTGYTAAVSLERIYFPIRIYGSQTYLSEDAVLFPPGYYDSVQVVLGSGEGHNWWCLAYPSLCFIDSSYDYIPKDSDIYKWNIGTTDKYTLIKLFYGEQCPATDKPAIVPKSITSMEDNPSSREKIPVYFSFKLWELIKSLQKKSGK